MKLHDLKGMDKDDLLGLLGLETKHSGTGRVFGTLGIFGVGLLIGAGVALLLAPKAGSALRQDLRTKIGPNGTEAPEARDAAPRRA